jgi:hypothetical protein
MTHSDLFVGGTIENSAVPHVLGGFEQSFRQPTWLLLLSGHSTPPVNVRSNLFDAMLVVSHAAARYMHRKEVEHYEKETSKTEE